jgi:SAM-dependent methyltransferase
MGRGGLTLPPVEPVYAPEVFDRNTLAEARSIILTPEVGLTTEERWERETPWLAERMIAPRGIVLDVGCGVGRMSRVFTERGQTVVGVDISMPMRLHAIQHVASDRFSAVTPAVLRAMVEAGLRFRSAVAVWTLQHIPLRDLAEMIGILALGLETGSPLWTVDSCRRFVPGKLGPDYGWMDDGIDVPKALLGPFSLAWHEPMPEELCAPGSTLRQWTRRPREAEDDGERYPA